MGRTGEMKRRIIQSLSAGPKTTTELSAELEISPSTTSQHLTELRTMGLVESYPNEHFRNMRIYSIRVPNPVSQVVPRLAV